MDLKFDDSHITAILQAAVMTAITPENRDKLIASAVTNLLSKETGTWDKRNGLQKAFDEAVHYTAVAIVKDQLEKDEAFGAKVKTLIADAVEKAFGKDRQVVVDALADGIRNALRGRDR